MSSQQNAGRWTFSHRVSLEQPRSKNLLEFSPKHAITTQTPSGSLESLCNISPSPPTPAPSANGDEGFSHFYSVPQSVPPAQDVHSSYGPHNPTLMQAGHRYHRGT